MTGTGSRGAEWAMDELVHRAGLALAGSALAGRYSGAPNGRVREVPDQRVVRWYTSIGLVDRPFGGRGRGARYGERHLRQIVAVKQLQGQGLPLAEIQARLAGIDDVALAELTPLPADVLAVEPAAAGAAPAVADRPAAGVASTRPDDAAPAEPDGAGPVGREPAGGPGAPDVAYAQSRRFWTIEVAPASRRPVTSPDAPAPAVEPLAAVRLAPDVLLILPGTPGPGHLQAVAEAARPLLTTLREHGLIAHPAVPAEPTEGAPR